MEVDSFPIVGFVICQDSFPDILRCLDSLTCCDEIYVCDGGSKDGSRQWLESVKDIYHLKIFDRTFDTMQAQRNFLLSKLPPNVWVINIDQDEALSPMTTKYFRQLVNSVSPEIYQVSNKEKRVLTFDLPYLILINDFEHYCYPYTLLRGKTFFYYEVDLAFYHPYHSEPSYSEKQLSQYTALTVPNRFCIFHYALFNPKRHEQRRHRLQKLLTDKESSVEWEYHQWFTVPRKIKAIPDDFLVQ